jgi:hypothetical protein
MVGLLLAAIFLAVRIGGGIFIGTARIFCFIFRTPTTATAAVRRRAIIRRHLGIFGGV